MEASRRAFLKTGIVGGVGISVFGFNLAPLYAQTRELKIARTTETRSTCPYCAVSCGVIIHTLGDKSRNVKPTVVHIEGDPDHPINKGTLCPKGVTLKQNIVNERRLTKVQYRAPGSDHWEEKSWDFAIDRIAHLLKQARDEKLREKDEKGQTLNALTAVGVIGGCTDTNENNYLLVKAFRAGLGIIPMEQQARI
jgi:formate dehydrogenase major subunit